MFKRLACLAGLFLATILAVPGEVQGQDYTGTYTVTNTQGATVTLTLKQDPSGGLTGTMVGSDVRFQIEGMVEEGIAVGAMYDESGGVLFEAQLQGNELLLSMFEVGPDGAPNYAQSRDVVLTRAVAAAPSARGATPSAGNPLGAGNPLAGGSDPFVGSFVGESIALTLQGGSGTYTGTLTFQGTAYPVSASASGGRLTGQFTVSGQGYSFDATLQGDRMTLVSAGTNYQLVRQGGSAGVSANPLVGGVPGGGGGGGGESGLSGSWSCQTGEGMARLEFLSASQLSFNGERSQYTLGSGAIRVMEEWGPAEYRYQMSGNDLAITAPDGSSMRCNREAQGQGRGAAGAGGAAGQGSGLERLVQGEKCGYSSSPDGGFSTTRRLIFDGNGRFVYTTLSEVDVPEVIGYGQAAGDPGTYRVMGPNKGDEVHLYFDSGDRIVMYVHHLYRGEIMELWYNDLVYAPGLCPGAEP
jgi:hypothetical protein